MTSLNPSPTDLVESFVTSKERFKIYCEHRDLGLHTERVLERCHQAGLVA